MAGRLYYTTLLPYRVHNPTALQYNAEKDGAVPNHHGRRVFKSEADCFEATAKALFAAMPQDGSKACALDIVSAYIRDNALKCDAAAVLASIGVGVKFMVSPWNRRFFIKLMAELSRRACGGYAPQEWVVALGYDYAVTAL